MAGRQETFTWLLMREIRAHLEHMATDPKFSSEYRDAFYAASREVGRNTRRFVAEARRKVEWNIASTSHDEAANGR